MKKRFICFFLISVLLSCQVASATLSIPLEAFEKIEKEQESEPYYTMTGENGIVTCYTKHGPYYASRDGINYAKLNGNFPSNLSKVGDRYISFGGLPYGVPENYLNGIGDGPLYIYDENLNLIASKEYEGKIGRIYETKDYSKAYFDLGKKGVYSTTDGENWIECEEIPQDVLDFNKSGSFFGPKHNGYVTYPYTNYKGIRTYRFIEKQDEMCPLIFKTNGIEHYEVVGETEEFSNKTYDLIDTVSSSTFTCDGIYHYTLPFEATSWNVNGYFYFETYDSYYRLPESYFTHTYVTFGDKLLAFEEPPKMDSGRILVPMRFLFEQMGGEVGWNPTLRIASFITKQNTVDFPIGSKTAFVNGTAKEMDTAAKIINNKTYIPLRFLSESLGYNVKWDADTRTAHITTD